MARTDPQVNLRIPANLKASLDASANENKRSLTAEIVARLERSFVPRQMTLGLERQAIATALTAVQQFIDAMPDDATAPPPDDWIDPEPPQRAKITQPEILPLKTQRRLAKVKPPKE